jgi:hypothetical protein
MFQSQRNVFAVHVCYVYFVRMLSTLSKESTELEEVSTGIPAVNLSRSVYSAKFDTLLKFLLPDAFEIKSCVLMESNPLHCDINIGIYGRTQL